MSILEEIEAFESWLETNSLSPLAQLLWYKLASIKNRLTKTEWFSISNQELMTKTCILSEHTLIEARNELKRAGLIDFVSGKKGQPTLYKLNPISNLSREKPAENTVQKMHCKKYTANFAVNQDNSNSNTSDNTEVNTAENTLQKMQCKKCSENFAVKESEQKSVSPVDSCSQTALLNKSQQNDKDINIFDINNNNTNTLNKNQENLEILENNKLTNVNTEVGLKEQGTTGEGVNNPPPVVNSRQLIADLVKRFEEITGKHDKKLYPLLGQLYNDYGYAEVLWALDRLEWGLKNKKIEKPEGYLINVLKNGNDKKKESEADGKRKKDNRRYGELLPDDPYSIIKPIRLGKQPDPDFDPYASIPVIRLGQNSTA
uniref:DnaD domain protein n=1 Tax=Caldicellulosiruptor owensensis TaxID=55205 RepID=A0A7C5Z933_9FIRM